MIVGPLLILSDDPIYLAAPAYNSRLRSTKFIGIIKAVPGSDNPDLQAIDCIEKSNDFLKNYQTPTESGVFTDNDGAYAYRSKASANS